MFVQAKKASPLVEACDLARNFPMRQGLLGRKSDVSAVRDVTI